MKRHIITGLMFVSLFSHIALGVVKEVPIQGEILSAATNRWLTGEEGRLRKILVEDTPRKPLIVKEVNERAFISLFPKVKLYQVEVLSVKLDDIKNNWYDKVALVADTNCITFIESDQDAVNYLNSNRVHRVFSTECAVREILAFGELRGYTLMSKETLQILKRGSLDEQPNSRNWSFSVLKGEQENIIEVTFLTFYKPESSTVIFSDLFIFKFNNDGQMRLKKRKKAASSGGFA